jgi:ElaB/YqjD/DUF883 family membrane-anchored ribosome-binding protein
MGEAADEVRSVNDFDDRATGTGLHTHASGSENAEAEEGGVEAAQIRSEIEQTRAGMSETIDALQEKLDPARIAEQVKDQLREKATEAYDSAKSAVREATIGKAEKIMANVSDTVSDLTERTGTAVKDSSSSIVQYIRDNPVSFAFIGIGAGMLAFSGKRKNDYSYGSRRDYGAPNAYGGYRGDDWNTGESSISDRARQVASGVADKAREATDRASDAVSSATSSVREAASSAVDTTREQFSHVSEQARHGAQVATDQFRSTLHDSPLALGIAALAAGAIVGLSLPSTRIEGEYMGEARDRVVDKAKSMAHEAGEKVQRVTEEAGRTLKDAAEKEGLTVGETGSSANA